MAGPEKPKIVTSQVVPMSIEKELKTSFLDYAMSVIVSRALPDVRDGLKPVHRRILYSMHNLGLYHEKPYRKAATVVGYVMGHYHPHGDSAIYQSMVGMAQDFSKRHPLLDGQGNWGSIDGDNAASMRYTEVRMDKIARDIIADLEKNTVDFVPNFDESLNEPVVMPSRVPNLLVNGATGIAVGMATSIPPHNLGEIVEACIALLRTPDLSEEQLFDIVPGPDFPTGAMICGRANIIKAYRTGHGSVKIRAVVDVEETKKLNALIIKEIPYQINKSDMIAKIADLVKNKVVEGVTNIRDESSRKGIRVVIELRRNENPQVVLNQLYKHTTLQTSQSMLLLGLYQNRPMIFTLRELMEHFLEHRREVVTRRTQFELTRHQEREHILQGLMIALENIDAVIVTIKASEDSESAQTALRKQFKLSEKQCKAILEMRLHRLTGLERGKIETELEQIKKMIEELKLILKDDEVLKALVITELEEVKRKYANPRRTSIEPAVDILSEADLVPDEEMVVTLTRKGYTKRVSLDTYTVQHRGGKGKKGMADLGDSDDVMQDAFLAKNHDDLLFFTTLGRVYSLKVFQVPEASRTARGRAIVNLLPLVKGETVVKLLCLRDAADKNIVFVTKKGTIKKTAAKAFAKIRTTGIRAIHLDESDELMFTSASSGKDTIVIATHNGQGIRFNEKEVRVMGRTAAGVRGIKLREGDFVVGLAVISDDCCDLLFATARGYGKRVRIGNFRIAHRGGFGVRTIPTDKRNGKVIGLAFVCDASSILLIDTNGKIIRLSPTEIRTLGRQAKGVRLIRLEKKQVLSSVVAFEEETMSEEEKCQTSVEPDGPLATISPEGEITSASEETTADRRDEREEGEVAEEAVEEREEE